MAALSIQYFIAGSRNSNALLAIEGFFIIIAGAMFAFGFVCRGLKLT